MLATEDFKNFKPISINKRIETDELLGPLPDNWEMSKYGKYNRCFFVDHDSKTTTWVDPRYIYLTKNISFTKTRC